MAREVPYRILAVQTHIPRKLRRKTAGGLHRGRRRGELVIVVERGREGGVEGVVFAFNEAPGGGDGGGLAPRFGGHF